MFKKKKLKGGRNKMDEEIRYLLIEETQEDSQELKTVFAGKGSMPGWKSKLDEEPSKRSYRLTEIGKRENKLTIAQCFLFRGENYEWPETGNAIISGSLDKRNLGFLEMVADVILK